MEPFQIVVSLLASVCFLLVALLWGMVIHRARTLEQRIERLERRSFYQGNKT